ncbi:MAG: hypothetical protein KKC76_12285 [Proteobacteria bacterium]|nr:hypothetical protein [Pseudomonadota bacterium]MBU4295318.1 hypothetical protein [Pseudomonadota bacterium]MCG2748174.1 hypothetical protein [Desulfobulbaceae bacterium]
MQQICDYLPGLKQDLLLLLLSAQRDLKELIEVSGSEIGFIEKEFDRIDDTLMNTAKP